MYLLICKGKGILDIIKYVRLTKKGQHLNLSDIIYKHIKEIEIKSKEPVKIQVEGEYLGTTPAKIKVAPKALNIIIP